MNHLNPWKKRNDEKAIENSPYRRTRQKSAWEILNEWDAQRKELALREKKAS